MNTTHVIKYIGKKIKVQIAGGRLFDGKLLDVEDGWLVLEEGFTGKVMLINSLNVTFVMENV
jgi:hypothetical protein